MGKIRWGIFAFFSIVIGIYPLVYGLVDMSQGFLGSKPEAVKESSVWYSFFYTHISFGAISLLIGWSQFSQKIRRKWMRIHRLLGKIYVVAVILSGLAGLYLSFYATGGVISGTGFGMMAIFWLVTTFMAYLTIRKGKVSAHEQWMIRSYALCWAAVTLRIWLPFLQAGIGMEFISAYLIVSWLSWVPNWIFAEIMIYQKTH